MHETELEQRVRSFAPWAAAMMLLCNCAMIVGVSDVYPADDDSDGGVADAQPHAKADVTAAPVESDASANAFRTNDGRSDAFMAGDGAWSGQHTLADASLDTQSREGASDASRDGSSDASRDGANEGGDAGCAAGQMRFCVEDGYVGNCAMGFEACKADGTWGACSVQKQSVDSCLVDGDDATCDGTANSGCNCVENHTRPCGPQLAQGVCKLGTQTCTGGMWDACKGAVYPKLRDCTSQADNDCDGRPDNTLDTVCKCVVGMSQVCNAHPGQDGKGPCKSGTQKCVGAANSSSSDWASCAGFVEPAPQDTCDPGNDANCNGKANDGTCACLNGQTQTCSCSTTRKCVGGVWAACTYDSVDASCNPDASF